MARAVENFGKEADNSAELYKKAVATIASIRAAEEKAAEDAAAKRQLAEEKYAAAVERVIGPLRERAEAEARNTAMMASGGESNRAATEEMAKQLDVMKAARTLRGEALEQAKLLIEKIYAKREAQAAIATAAR